MKRISILIVGFASFILFSFAYNSSRPVVKIININKVVIDAGHGGHDSGALGAKYRESNIALAIALKLGAMITENFPDVEVIYTRQTDEFIELHKRAQIANENKADLFISIHCNSSKTPAASGTETWVMGLNKSQENLDVAKKENAAILMENDYTTQYDGFDPNSPEANILFSLYQNIYLEQSLKLAAKVQSQFEHNVGRINRGVKQAGFLVLYKTTMPGILIETGFISNTEEEAFIASDKGQSLIASGIYRAFKEYKNEIEGNTSDIRDTVSNKSVKVHPEIKPKDTSSTNNKARLKAPLKTDNDIKVKTPPKTDTINNMVRVKTPLKTGNEVKAKTPPKTDTIRKIGNDQDIFFRVQFTVSSTKKRLDSPEFKNLPDIKVYFHQGLYKYTAGNESTLEDAVELKNIIQKKGFKDAFVVAFQHEERITTTQAVELLKKQKK